MSSLTRRAALVLPAAGMALLAAPSIVRQAAAARQTLSDILAGIEARHGGRLGVMAINHATGETIGHRQNERFGLCSTFKLLLAGLVLQRVDAGVERLDRRVPVTAADIVAHSPLTQPHVGDTMSVAELCHAIMTVSDNAGANLLLKSAEGPQGITAFARGLGDEVTRLDRYETGLNAVTKGDPRDTTTPAAMCELLRKIVLGDALSVASRRRLIGWMREATTGLKRLRAGLPPDWIAGDKTGTGPNGQTNDVAVAWAPDGPGFAIAAYYVRQTEAPDANAAVLADVGKVVAAMV